MYNIFPNIFSTGVKKMARKKIARIVFFPRYIGVLCAVKTRKDILTETETDTRVRDKFLEYPKLYNIIYYHRTVK